MIVGIALIVLFVTLSVAQSRPDNESLLLLASRTPFLHGKFDNRTLKFPYGKSIGAGVIFSTPSIPSSIHSIGLIVDNSFASSLKVSLWEVSKKHEYPILNNVPISTTVVAVPKLSAKTLSQNALVEGNFQFNVSWPQLSAGTLYAVTVIGQGHGDAHGSSNFSGFLGVSKGQRFNTGYFLRGTWVFDAETPLVQLRKAIYAHPDASASLEAHYKKYNEYNPMTEVTDQLAIFLKGAYIGVNLEEAYKPLNAEVSDPFSNCFSAIAKWQSAVSGNLIRAEDKKRKDTPTSGTLKHCEHAIAVKDSILSEFVKSLSHFSASFDELRAQVGAATPITFSLDRNVEVGAVKRYFAEVEALVLDIEDKWTEMVKDKETLNARTLSAEAEMTTCKEKAERMTMMQKMAEKKVEALQHELAEAELATGLRPAFELNTCEPSANCSECNKSIIANQVRPLEIQVEKLEEELVVLKAQLSKEKQESEKLAKKLKETEQSLASFKSDKAQEAMGKQLQECSSNLQSLELKYNALKGSSFSFGNPWLDEQYFLVTSVLSHTALPFLEFLLSLSLLSITVLLVVFIVVVTINESKQLFAKKKGRKGSAPVPSTPLTPPRYDEDHRDYGGYSNETPSSGTRGLSYAYHSTSPYHRSPYQTTKLRLHADEEIVRDYAEQNPEEAAYYLKVAEVSPTRTEIYESRILRSRSVSRSVSRSAPRRARRGSVAGEELGSVESPSGSGASENVSPRTDVETDVESD